MFYKAFVVYNCKLDEGYTSLVSLWVVSCDKYSFATTYILFNMS